MANRNKQLLALLLCGICIAAVMAAGATAAIRPFGGQTLRVGDKGEEVLAVKERLQELRYIRKATLSRKYTEKTAESVRAFQRVNGLQETGEVDAITWEALFSDRAVGEPRPTMPPLAEQPPKAEPDWPERDEEGFLALVRAFGASRILFGTDSPWSGAEDSLQFLRELPLSEEDKAAILGENARALLEIGV